jgi:hypothetical protein
MLVSSTLVLRRFSTIRHYTSYTFIVVAYLVVTIYFLRVLKTRDLYLVWNIPHFMPFMPTPLDLVKVEGHYFLWQLSALISWWLVYVST